MRVLDTTPFYRSTVGFDRLFSLLDSATKLENQPSYPPYNIERVSENAYRIELAVAGFAETDLNIEVHENVLKISGKRDENAEDGGRNWLYQGIAGRSFERRFHLADHVEVKGAKLENGLLTLELERVIPEALKPRKVQIAANADKLIENSAA